MNVRLTALVLVGLACGTAQAQTIDKQDLLRAAYGMRRAGDFDAAVVAFEQYLDQLPKSPHKKVVALELADLFLTLKQHNKALRLFRINHDIPREFEVLFELEKFDEALTLARLVKYPKGEGEALARKGQVDSALQVYQRAGLHRERGDLLLKKRRYEEAAEAFARVPDDYWRGRALDYARKRAQAREAYNDAREGIMFDLRHEVLPKVKRAKQLFDQAPDGVTREQARIKLAEAYGEAGEAYEKLAVVYARTGRDKADKLFDNAIRFVQQQIDTLLDGGGDAFGQMKVDALDLRARQEEIRALKDRLG